LLLLAVLPRDAYACICPGWQDPTYDAGVDVGKAAAVFEGQVLAVEQDQDEKRARVRVLRSWKGATAGEEKILVSELSSCGAPFELGEVFLFDVWLNEGRLRAGLCRTTRRRDAGSMIQALGPPLPGSAEEAPPPPPSASGPGAVPRASPSGPPSSPPTGSEAAPRGCAGCAVASSHPAPPWWALAALIVAGLARASVRRSWS
jgi:MYXO-CTERM domain-containing protein